MSPSTLAELASAASPTEIPRASCARRRGRPGQRKPRQRRGQPRGSHSVTASYRARRREPRGHLRRVRDGPSTGSSTRGASRQPPRRRRRDGRPQPPFTVNGLTLDTRVHAAEDAEPTFDRQRELPRLLPRRLRIQPGLQAPEGGAEHRVRRRAGRHRRDRRRAGVADVRQRGADRTERVPRPVRGAGGAPAHRLPVRHRHRRSRHRRSGVDDRRLPRGHAGRG